MIEPTEQQSDSANKETRALPKRSGLAFIIVIFFGLIFLSQRETVNTVDCSPALIASNPDVIMLGAWWCTYCYQAKKYFQRNDIHYCEYDMENTTIGKRLYQQHGGGAVPILLIGKYQLNGFSEQQIETALASLNIKPENAE